MPRIGRALLLAVVVAACGGTSGTPSADPTGGPPASVTTASTPTAGPSLSATAVPSPSPRTYAVQAGDTPIKVAHTFGISVAELEAANPSIDFRGDDPLKPDYDIGTVVVIPERVGRRIATRIVVAAIRVDVAVVEGSLSGPTLCGAAFYLPFDEFGQPGEGRSVYVYANARPGAFGPIHDEVKAGRAADLVGLAVEVYTDDEQRFTYRIDEVLRDVRNLERPLSATGEHLWLQTADLASDGRLVLAASPTAEAAASYAESHPSVEVVDCD